MSASDPSSALNERQAPGSMAAEPGVPDDLAPTPLWRRPSVWIAIGLMVALAAGAFFWRSRQQAAAAPTYVTEAVTRGDLQHRGDGQRHAAADAYRQHRQRALGHGDARPGRRQRPGQEGTGARRTRHVEIRRSGRTLARDGGIGHGQSRADGGHRQGIAGQSGATAGGRTPFRRQGAVEDGARFGPGLVRARAGRRGGGACVRGRCQGCAGDGRDESCPRRRSSRRSTASC